MSNSDAVSRVLDVVDLLADLRDADQEELLLSALSAVRKRDGEGVPADD